MFFKGNNDFINVIKRIAFCFITLKRFEDRIMIRKVLSKIIKTVNTHNASTVIIS